MFVCSGGVELKKEDVANWSKSDFPFILLTAIINFYSRLPRTGIIESLLFYPYLTHEIPYIKDGKRRKLLQIGRKANSC